jgi:hypothetical protein
MMLRLRARIEAQLLDRLDETGIGDVVLAALISSNLVNLTHKIRGSQHDRSALLWK